MKVMRPIKNAERLKNKELPKLNSVKEKERKWKLLYHNHQPHPQWSLDNVQKRNLPILQRLHSHRSAKSRSLRKAIKVLLRSPRKKEEMVKSLASAFNSRVQLKNNGQPKNQLSEEERFQLEQFF